MHKIQNQAFENCANRHTTWDAGRTAFHRADDAGQVRSRGSATRRVITHDSPDGEGDAVAAEWLAERLLFPGEPVEALFVSGIGRSGRTGLGTA